ncbi:MAG: hypothetical protein MJZ73_03845 [Bacteroidaceae bacterium]|nr:hypothetical protein [Bacteroidaceae bacterium]
MKKIVFAVIALFVTVPTFAQTEMEEDENPGGWNFTLPISLSKDKADSMQEDWNPDLSSSFSLGFTGSAGSDDKVDINMGESFELAWNNISSVKAHLGKNSLFRIGIGINWRNYRMTGRKMFRMGNDGTVTIDDYPSGATPKFSRIKTFGITLPVKFYQRIGRNVFVAAGPELGYITYSSLKTRYTMGDEKFKDFNKGLKVNRFQVNIGAEISIHGIGIYYKYAPTSVLQSTYGPKICSQTVGIKFEL